MLSENINIITIKNELTSSCQTKTIYKRKYNINKTYIRQNIPLKILEYIGNKTKRKFFETDTILCLQEKLIFCSDMPSNKSR